MSAQSDYEARETAQSLMSEIHTETMMAYGCKIDFRVVYLLEIVEKQLALIQSLHERIKLLEDYNYHG